MSSGQKRLKQDLHEYTKTYIVYDNLFRMQTVYTAKADTPDQGSCTRTDYSYSGGSNLVVYRKESDAVWSLSWEQ